MASASLVASTASLNRTEKARIRRFVRKALDSVRADDGLDELHEAIRVALYLESYARAAELVNRAGERFKRLLRNQIKASVPGNLRPAVVAAVNARLRRQHACACRAE